jgi:hypothetical protein
MSRLPALNQFVLDIEIALISIIQGLALSILATEVADPSVLLHYQTWPYIITGLVIILFFWSQSIIHALSFIRWPLDLIHTFLYFLIAFVEVLLFKQFHSPAHWFGIGIMFFALAGVLYAYDLHLLKARESHFVGANGKALFAHLLQEQKAGLYILIPLGLLFSIGCTLAMYLRPELFVDHQLHVLLGVIQALLSLFFLGLTITRFKERARLLETQAD